MISLYFKDSHRPRAPYSGWSGDITQMSGKFR
jgi:hypothetical protein